MKKIPILITSFTTFILVQLPLSLAKDFQKNDFQEKNIKIANLSEEFNNQKRNEIIKYNKGAFFFNKCLKIANERFNYYEPPEYSFNRTNDEEYYNWRPKYYITKTESGSEVVNKISLVNYNKRKIVKKADRCHDKFWGIDQPTIAKTYNFDNGYSMEMHWKDSTKDELIIFEK